MSFGDQVRQFGVKVERVSQDAFVNIVSATKDSITDGSSVTGSPGQPIDTGYLRASWQIGWGEMPAFTMNGLGAKKDAGWSAATPSLPSGPVTDAYIATNVVYAEPIEEGVVSVGRGNVTGNTKQRINLRDHTRIDTGSQIGGHHSVALTIAGFSLLVADEVRKAGS